MLNCRSTVLFLAAVTLSAFWLVSGPALACAFDMVKPERTQIDWIVDAETLVLARPSDANPFAFEVTRVLHGEGERPPIDQLVDSATRRKFAVKPADRVLFAYRSELGWRRVAIVDDSFRDVLQAALDHRISWQTGMPQSRIDFIAALQDSSTPAHKAIVIGELDKIPYADLRQFDLRISSDELLGDLWTPDGYPYQAIRALLLGLSEAPSARQEIHEYIDRVRDWNWANNLGAFSAAFIEQEGASGVAYLAQSMLLDPDQPLEKLEQIVMAMSVHHDLSDKATKSAIRDVVQKLVDRRPEAGVIVARQFSLRSDWSQAAVLEPLVQQRKVGLSDLFTISVYLARARETDAGKGGVVFE